MSIPTQSFEAIYEQYSATIQWMSGLGINLAQGRTSHYERLLRKWKDDYKNASKEELDEVFPDFVSSMLEISEFVRIYNAFHGVSPDKLASIIEKLRKGVNGPIHSADETSESTAARNFLFEAIVAAKANRPDRGVEAILDARSDTGIRFNGKKIWVECKRVTTTDKIEKNVRKASSQLEIRLGREVGSGHRGIVALDITKIFNWGDKIFASKDDQELSLSLQREMDEFIKQYSQVWQRIYERRHKKIIGTLVCFSFMATSEARNLLVFASQWGINPRQGIAGNDQKIQEQLATILASRQ